MKWNTFISIIECFNTISTPIGFFVSIIAYLKINGVEKSIKLQKENILFDKKYKSFCKDIDNIISIIKKEGIKDNIAAISSLCDKISRYTGGIDKKELKELNNHISNIKKINSDNGRNNVIEVEQELNSIKNLIESIGEKNGIR